MSSHRPYTDSANEKKYEYIMKRKGKQIMMLYTWLLSFI